ncbi:MAG: hypothetical protein WA919_03460 [Coleofasciculaceae cyanobacterium]
MRAYIVHPHQESYARLPVEVLGIPSKGQLISVELNDEDPKLFEITQVQHQCRHDIEAQSIEADALILYCKVLEVESDPTSF